MSIKLEKAVGLSDGVVLHLEVNTVPHYLRCLLFSCFLVYLIRPL